MGYNVGFVMDQIAGHVTNYRNLRAVARDDPEMNPTWHEIHYYKAGGAIERVREHVLPFLPTYPTGILRGSLEVHRALRQRRYDALMSNASVGVFFSHVFRTLPTLIDFDSTPRQIDRMAAYGASADPWPLAGLKHRLSRAMLHSATLLQAWSRWAKQSAVEEYGVPAHKVVVNPPGVDLQFWRPGADGSAHAAGTPRRVLFVGGDFRRKGGPLLLDWYKTQDPAACELHIVTREAVDARPGVHVYRDLHPNSEPLLRLYQQSHLFVLPSLGECFGIATIEAMGAGLPVIATDVGGTADIIEPGRNGFIIPSGDLPALTRAMSAALGDEDERRRMGRQSRLLAEQRFDVRQNARRTFAYLKEIAATNPAPAVAPA